MLERQVSESALHGQQRLVAIGLRQLARQQQGLGVAGKRLRRIAEGIAGQLVEHDDARQRTLWRGFPVAQAASDGGDDQVTKALHDKCVKSVILAEPFHARLAVARIGGWQEPEIKYGLS